MKSYETRIRLKNMRQYNKQKLKNSDKAFDNTLVFVRADVQVIFALLFLYTGYTSPISSPYFTIIPNVIILILTFLIHGLYFTARGARAQKEIEYRVRFYSHLSNLRIALGYSNWEAYDKEEQSKSLKMF